MLNIIVNNPYRILGVYSNSSKKEQLANKAKMQAFLRVKKSMAFPMDLKGILPTIERTQDVIDKADSCLVLQNEQVKNAQFWFIKNTNQDSIDDMAFNYLSEGNLDEAIKTWTVHKPEFLNAWYKRQGFYSLQNLFVSELIKGNYREAIELYAVPLYQDYADEFIKTISENSSCSSQDLIHNVIDILQAENVDLSILAGLTNPAWKAYLDSIRVTPIVSQLETAVSKAKEAKKQDTVARLNAGKRLITDTKHLLTTLKGLIGASETRYQIIADKIAQEILQCSIDYYNDTEDLDGPIKALPLCEYACTIAVGQAARQRCQENKSVIEKAAKRVPPTSVMVQAKQINDLFTWYDKQPRTSSSGRELLKKAQNALITIKEILGKEHPYYLEVSSNLGSAALSNVIDEVNEAQKEDDPVQNQLESLFGGRYRLPSYMEERRRQKAQKLKNVLRSAWQTIVYIDLLDTTDEFQKVRYQPNRKTLHSIISNLRGFDYPDDNYIIKGCCCNVSADKKFFWCDTEHYNSCENKSQYKTYLRLFPHGKHAEEAKNEIAKIEEHERKVRKYLLIAVAIVASIILAIVCCSAMSTSSSNESQQGQDATEQSSDFTVSPEETNSEDMSLEEAPIDDIETEEDTYTSEDDIEDDNSIFENEGEDEDDGYNEIENNEYEY